VDGLLLLLLLQLHAITSTAANPAARRVGSPQLRPRDVISRGTIDRGRFTRPSVEDEERLHRHTGRECRQQHGRHMAREKQSVADGTRANVTQYVSPSWHARLASRLRESRERDLISPHAPSKLLPACQIDRLMYVQGIFAERRRNGSRVPR
jgi:hypothetical protein